MKKRLYICHTYYHVYISCLKELGKNRPESGAATMVLSLVSTDFGDLKSRLEASGLFAAVLEYDEKVASFFPHLEKYQKNSGNVLRHMLNRIIFCKKLGKAQIPYLSTDFRGFDDIYVYCDSDPIGYYLNYAKIPYHAVEDGLNCLVNFDAARVDNRGHFGIKTWLAKRNIIFIQNGYAKYCLDMEVNDISALKYPGPKYIEQSRIALVEGLGAAAKEKLLDIFIADKKALMEKLAAPGGLVLFLTQPLCDIETRKRIFQDAIDQYGQSGSEADAAPAHIIIKPHPMDTLDYGALFPQHMVLGRLFPMEILNFIPNLYINRVVCIYTAPQGIHFAGEIVCLGKDFMDKYDDTNKYSPNELL